jgi:hypothetical protein
VHARRLAREHDSDRHRGHRREPEQDRDRGAVVTA